METRELHVVTGAFGYTGKYIARRLISEGKRVRTLTGHPDRPNPFAGAVEAVPFHFERPAALVESLRGAAALYNTYWVRFTHGPTSFNQAVTNTRILFDAAREARVPRVVHVSITNPAINSRLPYFRGKAELEEALKASGLSYAILRPTVIFGAEDILINNIAWLLRHLPVFAIPGDGKYRLQPIYVEDMSALAVEGASRQDNYTLDAVGPEVYTFNDLVRRIADAVGSHARIIHVPPGMALQMAQAAGRMTHDVMLTRDELDGLMTNLLISPQAPTGKTLFSAWLAQNADHLGAEYHSELARHFSPESAGPQHPPA